VSIHLPWSISAAEHAGEMNIAGVNNDGKEMGSRVLCGTKAMITRGGGEIL
jgi:hypothetical protein